MHTHATHHDDGRGEDGDLERQQQAFLSLGLNSRGWQANSPSNMVHTPFMQVPCHARSVLIKPVRHVHTPLPSLTPSSPSYTMRCSPPVTERGRPIKIPGKGEVSTQRTRRAHLERPNGASQANTERVAAGWGLDGPCQESHAADRLDGGRRASGPSACCLWAWPL